MSALSDAFQALANNPDLDQIKALADGLSANDPSGAGRAGLFYSGEFKHLKTAALTKAADIAELLVENDASNSFVRLDDTDLGKFLSDPRLKAELVRLTGSDAQANAMLFGDADNSLFARASERFAQGLSGPVVTITGDADGGRIFGKKELAALIANPNVTSIDGIATSKLRTITDANNLFEKVSFNSKWRTLDIKIAYGDEGLIAKVSASWGRNVGVPAFAGFNTAGTRFVDGASARALTQASFAGKLRSLARFIGPTLKVVGAAATVLELATTAANASTRWSAGDKAGAVDGTIDDLGALALSVAAGDLVLPANIGVVATLWAQGEVGFNLGGGNFSLDRVAVGLFDRKYKTLSSVPVPESMKLASDPAKLDPGKYAEFEDFIRNKYLQGTGLDFVVFPDAGNVTGARGITFKAGGAGARAAALADPASAYVPVHIKVPIGQDAPGSVEATKVFSLVRSADHNAFQIIDSDHHSITTVTDPTGVQFNNLQALLAGNTVGASSQAIADGLAARQWLENNPMLGITRQVGNDESLFSDGRLQADAQTLHGLVSMWDEKSPLEDFFNSLGVSFGQLGSIFGSNLSRLIHTDDPWESLGAGALIGTIGLELGQATDAGDFRRGGNPFRQFADLPGDLAEAGFGAVSSYLLGEWVKHWGIGEFGGGAVTSAGGAVISAIAENLQHLGESINPNFWVNSNNEVLAPISAAKPDNAVVRSWHTDLGGAIANAAGSFLGSFLASELVHFDTIGGQIGASIGSAIGSAIAGIKFLADGASLFLKFAVPGIGAFVGFIVGGLIGSVVKSGNPRSGAVLAWNDSEQQFLTASSWSKNKGSREAAVSFSDTVAGVLNGVIAQSGSKLMDISAVRTGEYGTYKKDYVYYDKAGYIAYRTADANNLINAGAFMSVSDLLKQMMGGDVYVKRALASTILQAGGNPAVLGQFGSFEINVLTGNLSTAADYASYLQNSAAINALIAAEPESAFSAGWIITFARVMELGLDKRAYTDWVGGWNAFLDETADGAIDGKAFVPTNLSFELDPDTNERLFVFTDADGALIGVLGDTIDTASKTKVVGTSGHDTITVSASNVITSTSGVLIGAAGANGYTIRVAALIDAGDGDDYVEGGDLGNDIIGGAGNDTLIGGKLDDWIFGGAGNDTLYASAGGLAAPGNGDLLDGGDGNDTIFGSLGSDWLKGGAGVDALKAGAGGDILDAGEGDDVTVEGGAGSDQYVFNFGYGHDVIFDSAAGGPGATGDAIGDHVNWIGSDATRRNWAGDGTYSADGSVLGGDDAIVFGAGIDMRNVVITRAGMNLVIDLANVDPVNGLAYTGDQLVITDWFNSTSRVEWLRFANGEEIRLGDFGSFQRAAPGQTNLVGTNARDYLIGNDLDNNILGLGGNDYGFGGRGDDFVSGDADDDLVMGGAGNDRVVGGSGTDTVFGDGGNDTLYGGSGNDLVVGGRGNDFVAGGTGDDVFRYLRGDGQDRLIDDYEDNWDTITVQNVLVNGYTADQNNNVWKNGVRYFDGAHWSGGTFDYDSATRTLVRWAGTASRNAGSDVLEFGAGINLQDLLLRRSGNDLEIGIAASDNDVTAFAGLSDKLVIGDWFTLGAPIETFLFVATGRHNLTSIAIGQSATDGADTLAGTSGDDWITGMGGDDVIDAGSGDDIVTGGAGNDQLRGGAGVDKLYGGSGADVLDGGAGADKLFGGDGIDIASYASAGTVSISAFLDSAYAFARGRDAKGDDYAGIEGLEGGSGADRLGGDDNQNTLRGGAGNDRLLGGLGDDVYQIDTGSGADTIFEGGFVVEQIIDANPNTSEAQLNTALFTATWTDLGYGATAGGDRYRYRLSIIRNDSGQEVYRSRDAVDFTYVDMQSQMPPPAAWPFSNGQWLLGAGRTGEGVQTVWERTVSGAGGVDLIEFGEGIDLADLTFVQSGADLDIGYSGGSVKIKGQTDNDRTVESIAFKDGLVGDLTKLRLNGATASADADLVIGGSGNDLLQGLAGDDILAAGAGQDQLEGGAGNDVLDGGAGADVLNGGTDLQSDGVALSAAPKASWWGDVARFVRSSAGVTVNLASRTASGGDAEGDTIVADANSVSTIEHLIGSGYGDTLTGDSRANRLFGLAGADTLDGGSGDDVLVGGDGDDTLTGGAGADNLAGEDGADVLYGDADDDLITGGGGADVIHGGSGKDQIGGDDGDDLLYGEDGDDALSGAAGADQLYGGAGADSLSGGAGNDALFGGAGDDTYVFDADSGADTVIDADGARNAIAFSGVSSDKIWITRLNNDLRVGVIGGASVVTVQDYFASGGGRMREIASADASIFLAYSAPLITAMSAESASITPASMPAAIKALTASYWHAGGKAAPVVAAQTLQTDEDIVLTGSVGAVDHDENITGYTVVTGPSHGALSLNGSTGAWTYTPSADWNGADGFSVRVADADGHSVDQQVSVGVAPVNDAPRDIIPAGVIAIAENSPPQADVQTFSAIDIDDPQSALIFTLADDAGGRFQISHDGQLQVKAGVPIDYEAAAAHQIRIRVTDAAGATFEKDFTVDVQNVNEAPSAPAALAQAGALLSENSGSPGALNGVVVATLSASDPEGTSPSFLVTSDPQNWLEISGAQVRLRAGVQIDFEALALAGWTLSDSDSDGAREIVYTYAVKATDGSLQSAATQASLRIEDVNEAPTGIDLAFDVTSVAERDRPDPASPPTAIRLGVLTGHDPDLATSGDFAELAFETTDSRFEILNHNELWLKAGAMASIDFETAQTLDAPVRVKDRAGGADALSFARIFTFAITDQIDVLEGGAGADTLSGQQNRDILRGWGGDDWLSSGAGNDDLYGGLGNDVLLGGVGDDLLEGEDDDDQLTGGAGADTLRGGAGADWLSGGDGDDMLVGGAGDDVLEGGAGADSFTFGSGFDTLTYASANAGVVVNLASGGSAGEAAGDMFVDGPEKIIASSYNDTITGTLANEWIDGGAGNDTISGGGGVDTLIGGDGADILTGGDDDDALTGDAGNDILYGGAGTDILDGGDGDDYLDAQSGDDMLIGGRGADILIGGVDNDTYLIDINAGHDEIRNFDPSGDDIDVIGYQDINRDRLWFEKSGDNLAISVIGADVVTTIKDWYLIADPTSRANHKIDFILGGQHFTKTINAEGLVGLMAGYAKPANLTALASRHADLTFENQWKNFWDHNGAPTIVYAGDASSVAAQTVNEDIQSSIVITVTDDVTPHAGITVTAVAVRSDDNSVVDTSIVQSISVSAPDANGARAVQITPKVNVSGVTAIKVRAVDPGGLITERVYALTVTAVADAPSLSAPSSLSGTLDSGSLVLPISAALNDTDGSETLEVIVSGLPSGLALNHGTNQGSGIWKLAAADLVGLAITGPVTSAQDFTLTDSATARESANGATASATNKTIAVVLNARPIDLVPSGAIQVNENVGNGTAVTTFSRTDPDGAGDTPTYALANSAGGRFAINASTGVLTVANGALLNYEAATSHQIRVRVTDSGGLAFEKDFSVGILNVNETPTDIWADRTLAFNENTASSTALAWFAASDPESNVVSYSLVDNAGGRYAMRSDGLLSAGSTLTNYEAATSHAIVVRATDAGGLYYDKSFTIAVNNVNEAPTDIWADRTLAFNENIAAWTGLAWFARADQDAGDGVTFSLVNDAGGRFSMSGSGLLSTGAVQLDYEAGSSRTIVVRATDTGGLTYDKSFVVQVNNVNEAPTNIWADRTLAFGENYASWTGFAWFGASDPENNIVNYSLFYDAGGRYAMNSNGLLMAGPTNINYEETQANWVGVRATDAGGLYRDQYFLVTVNDFNEAPWWTSGGDFGMWENNYSWGAPAYVGMVSAADQDWGGNGSVHYGFAWGDYGRFAINSSNGQIYAIDTLDYEEAHDRYFTVYAQDGAGATIYKDVHVGVYDVNESPVITSASGWWDYWENWYQGYDGEWYAQYYSNALMHFTASDPEGSTIYWAASNQNGLPYAWPIVTDAAGTDGWINPLNYDNYGWQNGGIWYGYHYITVSDGSGSRQYTGYFDYNGLSYFAPVILDLNGDGLNLRSATNLWVPFDSDGDGRLDKTGWLFPKDGFLVFDRNTDGRITYDELSFASDEAFAVSDLEGLRAHDTNENGFFDSNDAEFGAFRIWQDINQDGTSQSNELTTLASHDIVSIDLNLRLTGQNVDGANDNVVYGTTHFMRGDGSSGIVGDVALAWEAPPEIQIAHQQNSPNFLGPIVFDLDGNGVFLRDWKTSNILFDMDGDGTKRRSGWIGASDGVLVLDRDGDGQITTGAELSFIGDLEGAVSDLEGLSAFDTNANGYFDSGDARFAEFRIWVDANQDGVSQAAELSSLTDAGLKAVSLSLSLTGQTKVGATDNVIYATTDFVRVDGRVGKAGDVFLAYDRPIAAVSAAPAPPDAETAVAKPEPLPRVVAMPERAHDAPVDVTDSVAEPMPAPIEYDPPTPYADNAPAQLRNLLSDRRLSLSDSEWAPAVAADTAPAEQYPAQKKAKQKRVIDDLSASNPKNSGAGNQQDWDPYAPTVDASALSAPLGEVARQRLQMVQAMASFDPKGATQLALRDRRHVDGATLALLTSTSDLRMTF